jgi:predicted ArsR family transcriptional regulator
MAADAAAARPDTELARVLAVPLRRRILELVERSNRPVDVATLTDALGCNHNAVRQHLARLRDAGLVVEQREQHRSEPGRPRLLYTARTRPEPYARLARLLTQVVKQRESPRRVGRAEGRAQAEHSAGDAVDAVVAAAAREGFAPRRVDRARHVDVVLDVCPFADVAAEDPRTICSLHRGIAEGLVDALGGVRVESFVAHDPYDAGCVVRLRRTT